MGTVTLQLMEATSAHVPQLMTWFPTEHDCQVWGGPGFRFPFSVKTFVVDAKLAGVASYALIGDSAGLCGFGQYYLRAGRCHLSRLAIAPAFRGRGLGTELIGLLQKEGREKLGVSQSSLFVHVTNTAAVALYERLGFKFCEYPEACVDVPDSYYMMSGTASADANQGVARTRGLV